jgi:SAM-dependent methyltransferase
MRLSRQPALRWTAIRSGLADADHLPTWPPEVRSCDLRRALPYETGSVDAIYSSHVLEHLYLREAERLLGECHRVLTGGGILRLALPDFRTIANRIAEHPDDAGIARAANHDLHAHPLDRPRGLGRLRHALSGAYHRWQPTPAWVTELLDAAGFDDITEQTFRHGRLPDLSNVETRPESFFLEATR